MDNQGSRGVVVEDEAVDGSAFHLDGAGTAVLDVTGGSGVLGHNQRLVGLKPGDGGHAVLAGDIDAVVLAYQRPLGSPHGKLGVCQRLTGDGVPFQNRERGQRAVIEPHLSGHAGAERHGLGFLVQRVALRGIDFRNHIHAGEQVFQINLPVLVRAEQVCTGREAGFIRHNSLVGGQDFELRAGKRLSRHAVKLLDKKPRSGLVPHGQRPRLAGADHHGTGRPVQNVSGDCGSFRHDIGARFQARQDNLALAVRDERAVSNNGSLGGGDRKRDARKRSACQRVLFQNNDGGFGLVAELHHVDLARLHGDGLGCIL